VNGGMSEGTRERRKRKRKKKKGNRKRKVEGGFRVAFM
jgi:hypothetical protein